MEQNLVKLSIILVNWNTKELLRQCLGSIYNNVRCVNFEVIVVDNASTDESQEMVEAEFPEVILIENKENVGFGKANNQGMIISRGDFIALYNSDTYLDQDIFPELLRIFEEEKEAGIIGCRILYPDRTFCRTEDEFPNVLKIFFMTLGINRVLKLLKNYSRKNLKYYEVESIIGAFMLFKKEVFLKTKGFDENIFMYGEDLDFCWRVKKSNWKIIYCISKYIYHISNASASKIYPQFIKEQLAYKGIEYFIQKHYSKYSLFAIRAIIICFYPFRLFLFSMIELIFLGKARNLKSIIIRDLARFKIVFDLVLQK